MNTDISTSVMPTIGPNNSSIARIAAAAGRIPWSMWCAAPSTTTIASSTTMPIASTTANSVERLMVNPSAAIAANAPMIVTGTVVAGTSIARQSCRNSRITISTSTAASISVLYTSWIEAETNFVVSNGIAYCSPGGKARASTFILAATSCATCSALAPGAWKMPMPAAGVPSTVKAWP